MTSRLIAPTPKPAALEIKRGMAYLEKETGSRIPPEALGPIQDEPELTILDAEGNLLTSPQRGHAPDHGNR
jgi:hypothetical protein